MLAQESKPAVEQSAAASMGKKKGQFFSSVSGKFVKQLDSLMSRLKSTTSNFVRCIKPNVHQLPSVFDGMMVLDQLHCSGMMAALTLLQSGFPTRAVYDDLYKKYRQMMPSIANKPPREFVQLLFNSLGFGSDDFQCGKTLVFFRAGKLTLLEDARQLRMKNAAKIIQRGYRKILKSRKIRAAWFSCACTLIMYRRVIST